MGGMNSSAKAEVARAVAEAIAEIPGADRTYLSAAQVRRRYGGISDMTLWRWLTDEQSGFQCPLLVIQSRRLWRQVDLDRWDTERPTWQPPKHIDKSERRFNEGNPVAERSKKRAEAAKTIKRTKKDEGQVAADGEEPELPLG